MNEGAVNVSMDVVNKRIQKFLNDKNVVNLSADEFDRKLDELQTAITAVCNNKTRRQPGYRTIGDLATNEGIALTRIINYCRKKRTTQISEDILPVDELDFYNKDFLGVEEQVVLYCDIVEDATDFYTESINKILNDFYIKFNNFIEQQEVLRPFIPDTDFFRKMYSLYSKLNKVCNTFNELVDPYYW